MSELLQIRSAENKCRSCFVTCPPQGTINPRLSPRDGQQQPPHRRQRAQQRRRNARQSVRQRRKRQCLSHTAAGNIRRTQTWGMPRNGLSSGVSAS